MLVDPGWPQVADTADCRPKQLKLERAATATKISFDDTMDTGDRHRGRHTTHRVILTFQNVFYSRDLQFCEICILWRILFVSHHSSQWL